MVHITNVSVKAHFSHPQRLVAPLSPRPVRTQTLLKCQWMQVSASTTASFPRPEQSNFDQECLVFWLGSTTSYGLSRQRGRHVKSFQSESKSIFSCGWVRCFVTFRRSAESLQQEGKATCLSGEEDQVRVRVQIFRRRRRRRRHQGRQMRRIN